MTLPAEIRAECASDHGGPTVTAKEEGQDVSSGIYLIRLIGDHVGVQTRKMVLLR